MKQQRRQRVLLISRNSGTAWWRVTQPLTFLRDTKICDLEWLSPEDVPTRDRLFLESFDTFVFHQAWMDDMWQLGMIAKNLGKRVIFSCDDLIVGQKIPKFIKGGLPYNDPTIMRNVHDSFNLADKVIVTTPILAEQLAKFYEVPVSKFLVFPNLPSYDWFGRWFNAKQRTRQFAQTKRKGVKFRVGIISSLTHYDLEGDKEPDDLQIVLDAIAELGGNAKNFQFVMTTNENERLRARFPKDIDLEMKPMVPIRQYPATIAGLNLHAVVVPLQDNIFSNCKSDIKNTETAALGIPTLFQDTTPYKHCADDWFRCATPKDFASRLLSIRDWGEARYEETITKNYNRTFNQTIDYFGQRLNGYWLEGNLNIVGDAFLSFNPPADKDGIVAPAIKTTKEEVEDVQKKD